MQLRTKGTSELVRGTQVRARRMRLRLGVPVRGARQSEAVKVSPRLLNPSAGARISRSREEREEREERAPSRFLGRDTHRQPHRSRDDTPEGPMINPPKDP
jgi:hypothetical protein